MSTTRLVFGLVGLALAAHLLWLGRKREPPQLAITIMLALAIVIVALAVMFKWL